ncbi:MAG: PKD domain-containing protein [Bacteroidia bacterium]|nr:PKD domain-containing protein [Bacteroidia bacterium]
MKHYIKYLFFAGITVFLSLTAKSQATFTASDSAGCAPFTAVFQASGTNVQSYSWSFGNGQTAGNVTSTTTQYSTAGNYTVTLYVVYTDGSLDTVIRTNYIDVFTPPTVGFTASPLAICTGQSVQFTNQSVVGSGPIATYLWDFGDGTSPATIANPSHVYNIPGVFPVTLIITDINGCQDFITQTAYITVNAPPSANFTVSPSVVCNTSSPVSFNWTGSGTGITHSWNFGNGQTSAQASPSYTYTANGTYTVTHVVTQSGCSVTYTLPNAVQVGQSPPSIAIQGGGTQFCAGSPVCLTWSQMALNTISWSSGGGTPATASGANPCFTYNNAGNYTITATMTDNISGCTSNASISIQVLNSPTVSFVSADTVSCQAPHSASFTASAPGATSYSWNFGVPGFTSALQNPTFTYQNTGNFTVSLTVTNSAGCSTTLTKPSYIHIEPPVADFAALPSPLGCVPSTMNFVDQSTSTTGPITSWFWNLGNSTTSSLQNPSATYSATGQYTVVLYVENSLGCKDTIVKTNYIKIGTPPTVNFTANAIDVCASTPITFTNQSTPTGAGVSYQWTFGDGGQSSNLSPTYTYQDTGWFDVKLVVNNQGCKDSLIKTDFVHIKPPITKFLLTPNTGCSAPKTVTITNTSIYNPATSTFYWDFGDGTTSTTASPGSHTYNSAGIFNVQLTVTDVANGCTGTSSKPFQLIPAQASFAANQVQTCAPDSIFFFNISSNITGSLWDFGDGTTSTQTNPVHTYTTPGLYTVTLIVTNSINCKDTLTLTDYIDMNGLPVAFDTDTTIGCVPATIQFTDNTVQNVPIVQWSWDFGDGNTSSTQNPSHVYTTGGVYDVTLSVLDANGCISEMVMPQYIQINDPQASFIANYPVNCVNNPITFTSTSTGAGTGPYYQWSYGDGGSSTLSTPTPTHSYNQNGSYSVTLTITDIQGCSDSYTANNMITIGSVNANFAAAGGVTATCPPLCTIFNPFPSPPFNITGWLWDFGDGGTSNLSNPNHCYTIPGDYTVTYIAISDAGCQDTLVQNSMIHIDGPVAPYTITPAQACPGDTIYFNANGQNVVTYEWNFGDGNTSGLQNPTNIYYVPGNYQPVLTLWDAAGCQVIMPVTATISVETPPIADFMADSIFACVPVNVVFTNTSTPGSGAVTSWTWDYGDGSSNTVTTPTSPHNYTSPGLIDVSLIITDANGCKDTVTKNDYMYLIPNVQPPSPDIYTATVVSDDSVKVIFSAYQDVINDFGYYKILRSDNGGPLTLIATTGSITDTVFTDFAPAAYQNNYCYMVVTGNHCGTESLNGTQHCLMNVSSVPLQDAVQLDWTPYTGWNVDKYRIWRVQDYSPAGMVLVDSVSGNTTTFTDSYLDCWVLYKYRIEALELGTNYTSWSDTTQKIALHSTALNAMDVSLVTVSNNQNISVNWVIPPTITKVQLLKIERSDDDGMSFNQAALFTAPSIPINYFDNVSIGERHIYRIQVVDSCGDITPLTGYTGGNIVASATRLGNSSTITWNRYRNWPSGVSHYVVELFNKNNSTFSDIGVVPASDSVFVDAGPNSIQDQNCFRVRAYKQNDTSVVSYSNLACLSADAQIFIPNAFTPNGDSHNDFFEVKGNYIATYSIIIVNRWGQQMFNSSIMENSWDGTFRGKDVPEDVYHYLIEIMGFSGNRQKFNGTITLVR